MHINDLPDIVLARIFHWACNDPACLPFTHYSSETWRTKLALLAVCRIWRELAIPSVHRVSFIRYSPVDKPKNGDNIAVYHATDSGEYGNFGVLDDIGYDICVVKSNLDIIGNTNNKYWPRTIQLFIHPSVILIYSLQWIIKKIRNHATLLKKATRIEVDYGQPATIVPRVNEATDIAKASSIGEEISQLIPHVRYIEFGNHVNSGLFINFSQSLVKGYAHQLTAFECPQFALGKTQGFSDNLRCVYMDGDGESPYIPQICAANLTTLVLNYVSSSFDWSSFESNDKSKSLHFANLKWLKLGVDFENNNFGEVANEAVYPAHEFNYKVSAPKLETVILRLCPFTLSFLASIYGLTTIPNVELDMYRSHVCFTEFDLDMGRDKFASYAKNSQDDFQAIDYYAYMNDMFNIHGLAKNSKAGIVLDDNTLNYEQINWKYLSNIKVYCPFHVNDLRTLVSKAPRLETIHVNEIEIKENGKLLTEIQDEAATVELLSPNLKSISFDYIADSTESERDKFMVYLSKLTPRD